MDLRDSKNRLILIVIALGAALVIAVASCAGNDDGGSDQGDEQTSETSQGNDDEGGDGGDEGSDGGNSGEEPAEPLAEVTGGAQLTLTITSAVREEGDFLTVEGTLHNGGEDTFFDLAWAGGETELAGERLLHGRRVLGRHRGGKRYLILRDTSGRCLCTASAPASNRARPSRGSPSSPSRNDETVTVEFQVGDLPPATIAIS